MENLFKKILTKKQMSSLIHLLHMHSHKLNSTVMESSYESWQVTMIQKPEYINQDLIMITADQLQHPDCSKFW